MTETGISGEKAPAKIDVESVSNLVTSMSRLLAGLTRLQPFSDANLGLADWLTLTELAREDGISNKALGRKLGVSGQRANQICASLSKAGLITITQSADDNRAREIRINTAGRTKTATLNGQLKLMLDGVLQGKERSVAIASKHVKTLLRVVHAGRPEKQERADRQERKARRQAREERRLKQSTSSA